MSPQPDRGVMGSLPRSRPHRRSDKRPQAVEPTATGSDTAAGVKRPAPAKRAESAAPKARAAAKPAAKRTTTKPKAAAPGASHPAASRPAASRPAASRPAASQQAPSRPAADAQKSPGALETAVQAVAELTEIGLHAGARALRGTLSRLSR